ncbi:hypothetical protein EON63_23485 [archaeon]|nr:MAG: hypothetical protein EON63_23485 [archaeon]
MFWNLLERDIRSVFNTMFNAHTKTPRIMPQHFVIYHTTPMHHHDYFTYSYRIPSPGKAAMSVKYVAPSFTAGTSRRVEREGSILLEFAPIGSKVWL